MPFPQAVWAFFHPVSNTCGEHCPHNSPREGPGALWTTFLSHLETISMAREEKIHGWASAGSYVQAWSQRKGLAEVSQLKVMDEHKKSFFPFSFDFIPVSTQYVNWGALYLLLGTPWLLAGLLAQIKFVHPFPCHHNIGSGSTSWAPVWHQFFPDENPDAADFPPNVCQTYYIPLIKIMQRTRCLLFIILQVTVGVWRSLRGLSLSLSFELILFWVVCSHTTVLVFSDYFLRLNWNILTWSFRFLLLQ